MLNRRVPGTRAFTLVEIMVVVVIIGLLAAMGMPLYRKITLRSKATTVVNDFRAFAAPLISYNLQNASWPDDAGLGAIPTELTGGIPSQFANPTPIGGLYKWNHDVGAGGITPSVKAAISIESATGNMLNDDLDLLEQIDNQIDDGNLSTGSVRAGAGTLVYIIEP